MEKTKVDKISKLLKDFEFKFDNLEFECVICRSMLKNAYQSPCGCRYCLECVTRYLENATYCPGDKEECPTQKLCLDTNLQVDYIVNKRIATQIVWCPLPDCQYSTELRYISKHLSSDHSDQKCPFLSIGCPTSITGLSRVTRHLHSDGGNLEHSRLLAGTVGELQNEFERLFESFRGFKKESEDKLERITEFESRLDDIVSVQKEEIRLLREQAEKHEQENRVLRTKLMELFSQEAVTKGPDNKSMKDTAKDDTDTESIATTDEYPSYAPARKPARYAPFRWVVNNFKARLSVAQKGGCHSVRSEPFLSHMNGYLLYITVHPNGTGIAASTHVSVFVHLMAGPNDDRLEWPMKLETRLCLVDQHFGNIYADRRFSFSTAKPEHRSTFERPVKNRTNRGFGEPRLIELSTLFTNSRIYYEDSIILRCFVGDHR